MGNILAPEQTNELPKGFYSKVWQGEPLAGGAKVMTDIIVNDRLSTGEVTCV
jgi:hypothetical protein